MTNTKDFIVGKKTILGALLDKQGIYQPQFLCAQQNGAVYDKQTGSLLTENDPPVFTTLNETAAGPYVIICDHASKTVPEKLADLGLPPEELNRHIGWDVGTEEIGRYMSDKLKAPAIIAGYSRLVVDLNRGFGNPQQMPEKSDGTVVPGNQALSLDQMLDRVSTIYHTYHLKLSEMLDDQAAQGKKPFLIFVHSCAPEMDGRKRPWEIGILWHKNKELSAILMDELKRERPGYTIGDNQPYTLRRPPPGNSVEKHAESRGLPHVVVEFRQDLVDTPEKAVEMGAMFTRCLERAVERYQAQVHKKSFRQSFERYSDKRRIRNRQEGVPPKPAADNVRPKPMPGYMW